MKNYFNIFGVLAAACFVAVVGCTKVDDSLGLSLVPGDQAMKVCIDTLYGNVNTYTIRTDSTPTKSLGYLAMGYRNNSTFGKTVAGTYVQYVTGGFDSTYYYGIDPVIDSAFINLQIKQVSAAKSDAYPFGYAPEQIFGVYKSNKAFSIDSSYYANFDIAAHIDNTPLFTFKHKGSALESKSIKLEYTKGSAGDLFLNELVGVDTSFYSKADTAFINKFKGFYIAPISTTGGDAAIYYCPLSTYGSYTASFTVWAHNFKSKTADKSDVKNIKDTIDHYYYFVDDPKYSDALSFMTVKHDYTGSTVDSFLAKIPADTTAGTSGKSKVFVQSMGGVGTFVRFTDAFLDEVVKLKTRNNVKYANLVFNKAMMYLYLPESHRTAPYIMDESASRLGMYYKFVGYNPTVAPDYNYEYEIQYQTSLPYGGYLNRQAGRYEMDITTYLQRLLTDYEKPDGASVKTVQKGVIFAPQFNSGPQGVYMPYSQTELNGEGIGGGASNIGVPEFELTFTLIK